MTRQTAPRISPAALAATLHADPAVTAAQILPCRFPPCISGRFATDPSKCSPTSCRSCRPPPSKSISGRLLPPIPYRTASCRYAERLTTFRLSHPRNVGRSAYRCGQKATFALADLIGSRPVTCDGRYTDRYHRLVAVCTVGGTDLGQWMVAQGWALAYRRFSEDYVDDEDMARRVKAGLWAGTFVPPWQHRAER